MAYHFNLSKANAEQAVRGFTLIELLIVIAVVAILALVAIGGYSGAIKRSRVDSEINQFSTHLSYARSEAIKQGKRIYMVSKSGGWNNGWTISAEASPSTPDDIAVNQSALSDTLSIETKNATSSSTIALNKIVFHPTGKAFFLDSSDTDLDTQVNIVFSVGNEQRNIHISSLGRVEISKI